MKLEEYKKSLIQTFKRPIGSRIRTYEMEVSRDNESITTIKYSPKSYERIVEDMVKTKYSLAQEVSILRQQYTKIDEYNEYYQFVEQCKALAKEFINERNSIFNR